MNKESVRMNVSVLLMKSLERATAQYARECVLACGARYNFDAEEALKELNVENVGIQVNAMKKRGSNKVAKEKRVKEVKEKGEKKEKKEKKIALPFAASGVKEGGCCGLAYNGGLFTQCEKGKLESGRYCKVCQKEADGSVNGKPSNGTVEERLSCELMEYRDPKGRKPVAYMKIMERDSLERLAVEEEAGKRKITLDEIHFAVVVDAKKGVSGRPKALKKKVMVESVAVEDLFAQLVDDDSDSESETVLVSESEEIVDSREQENMERCEMKEADSESKKAGKEHKQAINKAAKEEKIAADKAAKEQKIVDDLAAKEQKIIDDLAAKLAKEEKMAADKAAKEQKIIDDLAAKALKESKKESGEKASKKESSKPEEKKPEEKKPEEKKKVTVKRITINGKQYLKTCENLLYDPETKEEMGIYEPETNTIKELPDESEDEVSEDGYESE